MTDEYRAERVLGARRVTEFPPQHDLPQRRGYHAYETVPQDPTAEHSVHDVASVLGLSAEMVSPELLDAVGPLLTEMDRLRAVIERGEHLRYHLEHEADHDPLLPCLNRRAFLRELGRRIDEGEGGALLAVIHIAGIERLRQERGLAAAEAAFKHAGAHILASLRASDLVGALGGSDFGVVLMGTSAEAGAQKLADIRRLIEFPPFSWDGHMVALVVRSGLHPLTREEDALAALAAADAALRR